MTARASQGPMRIKLSEEGRARLGTQIERFFLEEFDRELSDFQAQRLIDFFVRNLGAPVYNQAIQDARSFLMSKLDDLDGEFYEPEEPS
jgi:uncharacterized protein (DUF2164 family)